MLPILLVLAFATLILGAIYAYCVAKPHTDIADRLAVDSNAEADSSIFSKRETASLTNASTKDATSRDDQPEAALLFYTLTTPGVSLFHLAFELIMHHHTPQHLSSRTIYLVFLSLSSLILAGWLTTLSFWMHCELPPLNKSGQAVCPVQVRGHFMYGIHEVSITKVVIGWLVALVYVAHVVVLGMGYKAQRRVWRVKGKSGVEGDLETAHGEATEVVVRVNGDDDSGLNKEASVI